MNKLINKIKFSMFRNRKFNKNNQLMPIKILNKINKLIIILTKFLDRYNNKKI